VTLSGQIGRPEPQPLIPSIPASSRLGMRRPESGDRPGHTYPGMAWEPKAAFTALAACYRG
jgi:hypothetical protein